MSAGVWNLLIGLAAVGAGLSGRVMIFTNSSTVLVVAGAAIAVLGVVQIVRAKKQ